VTGQPYPDSYYAATRNPDPGYPTLAEQIEADVCICGGGFTGVATALSLAERGYSVVVLEQNRIGWGASGRNGGQVIGGFSGEELMAKRLGPEVRDLIWDIGWLGNSIIAERVEKYAIDCDFKYGSVTSSTAIWMSPSNPATCAPSRAITRSCRDAVLPTLSVWWRPTRCAR